MIRSGLVFDATRPRRRSYGRSILPLSVKMALASRRPELLGFSLTPTGHVMDALDELYGEKWGVAVGSNFKDILSAAIGKYKAGFSRDKEQKPVIKSALVKEYGFDSLAVQKLLNYLDDITAEKYPAAAAYMTPLE